MKAFLRMWNAPDVQLDCKELIIKEGVKIDIDGEVSQMLLVIASDGIYHPVLDVEVL